MHRSDIVFEELQDFRSPKKRVVECPAPLYVHPDRATYVPSPATWQTHAHISKGKHNIAEVYRYPARWE